MRRFWWWWQSFIRTMYSVRYGITAHQLTDRSRGPITHFLLPLAERHSGLCLSLCNAREYMYKWDNYIFKEFKAKETLHVSRQCWRLSLASDLLCCYAATPAPTWLTPPEPDNVVGPGVGFPPDWIEGRFEKGRVATEKLRGPRKEPNTASGITLMMLGLAGLWPRSSLTQ